MAHRRPAKITALSLAFPAALAIVAYAPSLLAAEGGAPEPLPPPAPVPVPAPVAAPPPAYVDPVATGVGETTSGGAASEGASVDQVPEAHERHHGMTPLAGYADGKFFLRDANDTFMLIPSARLQIDAYGYAGQGVKDYQRGDGSGLKADMLLKRERIELGGRILKRWYFWVAGDFAGGGQGGSESVKSTASNAAADAFIGVELHKWLRLQVGQFDLPFTAENVTSDNWLTFMERSMTARLVGAPYNKDLGFMARGESPKGHFSYAVAAVGGDGQNRPSPDNRVDFAGRFLFRPFAGDDKSPVQRMHVGFSGRWGRRDPDYVRYDAPGLSTPGGYTFWSPSYGKDAGETHVMPSKDQIAGAAEIFVPFRRFDVTGEFVYLNEDRREALKGSLGNTERAGTLKGFSYYVQASWWPFGEPRISGELGAYPDPKLNLPKEAKPSHPKRALQLAVRFEQLRLQYDSTDRSGGAEGVKVGTLDAKTKDIKVDVVQFGATYWATKHVRLTAMWSGYHFPGTPGVDNQAVAPGASKSADAKWLHEFSARVALAL
jgi:phosphate-selective porin